MRSSPASTDVLGDALGGATAPTARGAPPAERPVRPLRAVALVPLLLLGLLASDAWAVFAAPHRAVCPATQALVMGAAQYDGVPSPAFERRLAGALDLYESGCVERIVVTGGSQPGDRTSEGASGRRWLLRAGVPAAAVVAETESETSYQNIANSLPLLEGERLIVVTDDLHAHRSAWLARRAGLDVSAEGVPTGLGGRLAYGLRELTILTAYRLGIVR